MRMIATVGSLVEYTVSGYCDHCPHHGIGIVISGDPVARHIYGAIARTNDLVMLPGPHVHQAIILGTGHPKGTNYMNVAVIGDMVIGPGVTGRIISSPATNMFSI